VAKIRRIFEGAVLSTTISLMVNIAVCHPEREAVEGSPLHQQRKPTQETEA
jgi:hypothetical protein